MKVSELIEQLKTLPLDATVQVEYLSDDVEAEDEPLYMNIKIVDYERGVAVIK